MPVDRLDSWKEIGTYLGKDSRTAIRWEKQKGLPVHRVPGGRRKAVFAYANEIDRWLTSESAREDGDDGLVTRPALEQRIPLRLHLWFAMAGGLITALILATAGFLYLNRHAAQPSIATFTSDSLQAWDDHHHLLWEYRFPQPFATTAVVSDVDPQSLDLVTYDITNRAGIFDLYGDGKQEILAITLFNHGDSVVAQKRQVLSCFSPTGKLLWSYEPQTVLAFGDRTYSAPWKLSSFIVSDEPGRKTIWVNAVDYVWGKSFIARLDADGHAAVQFVNSGEIAVLERLHTAAGPLLWIGGFNDEYDTASVAILRDTQTYAVSPQTPGTHFACKSCGTGDPLAYFVLPRYDMGRALHVPNNKVFAISSNADDVIVEHAEISRAYQVLYDFSNDANPRPLRVNYAAAFWSNHTELERQGKLNHTMARCPDRLHPPSVRAYQAGQWREIAVPSVYSQ